LVFGPVTIVDGIKANPFASLRDACGADQFLVGFRRVGYVITVIRTFVLVKPDFTFLSAP